MENNYQIRYLPLAYEDLDEIDTYISDTLGNSAAAEQLMDKMQQTINRLTQFPYIGSEVADVYLAAKGYRKLVVDNYIVFHLVDDVKKEVLIMRVLYGHREYRNLL